MALKSFHGAVAVITGGASGIGLATAKALRGRGAHVVLADINASGLSQAEEQVRLHAPEATGQVLSVVTDVTSESQVQALMQTALGINGRIDLVITSAGIGRGGPIDQFTAKDMETMMNINFMGTFHCVRAALPTMRQQQSGHFVLLSSVAGKLGSPMLSGYCASKWAVRGFSSALRVELYGTGIGITTVYPAWVDTPMLRQEVDPLNLANVVALLTPEQVAEEILQAVLKDQRDLTLAPNPDIAKALQIMQDDPDKAEMLMGQSFQRRTQQAAGQQTH
jgi:NAD(P)-dependent dehydrogenase (short-subunit alcohol dehydrogenase family)